MNKKTKKLLSRFVVAFLAGLLSSGPAFAAGTAVGASATIKPGVNNTVSAGVPLTEASKGVKQFEVLTGTNGLVVDEAGTTPTNGLLMGVQLSTGPSDNSCYAIVADSAAATGMTLATTGRALVPPLVASASSTLNVEYLYPKQFHRGLSLTVSTPTTGTCRATVSWKRKGGSD